MNLSQPETFNPGVGATAALNLRVSVATLVRVLFKHPVSDELMLALERKATLYQANTGDFVSVKSQPFGGALRIHDLKSLQHLIGDFHFDSEESRAEQDFRIFIRGVDWERVLAFCLAHLGQSNDSVLESDPTRELTEEFADTLGVALKRDQLSLQAVGTVVEDRPSATENAHAQGYATSRVFRIFEVHVIDPTLASALTKNMQSYTDHELRGLALQDSQNGGLGRANAMLTLPFKEVSAAYTAILPEARNKPISFHDHQLDETVAAVLNDVRVPKYRRLREPKLD